MRRIMAVVMILIFCSLTNRVFAANSDGAVVVRIPDGAASRCINASTDQVWLSMRRVILEKKVRHLTNEKYAGVVVNTTISGDTGTKTAKIAFPRMVEARIEDYAPGHGISIPVEFGLLEGFRLSHSFAKYSNIDFDINVIKGLERNGWGKALNALVEITKKLPIPANPFTEGFQFFADYANSVVDASIQERETGNLKQSVIHLSFSPDGQCKKQAFESTGTIAIIFAASGTENDGFVDIGKINNTEYCWAAEIRPAFSVKFGKRSKNGKCVATTAIRNDYYGFYLNAIPKSVSSAPNLREDTKPIENTWSSFSFVNAGDLATTIGDGNVELGSKTAAALKWEPSLKTVPFGSVVATTPENTIVWRVSGVESSAFDIAEAFKRCAAHGINAENCLPGAAVPSELK